MGRETVTIAHWQGQSAEVRALLEPGEVILRGAIRDRLARSAITSMTIDAGDLRLVTDRGVLLLELGEEEGARWLAALQKPLPTLAEKLGVSASRLAYVMGAVDDAALASALQGAVTVDLARAAVLLVVLAGPDDLAPAHALALSAPHLAVWCIYPKGRTSPVSDAMVRGYLRDRGYVDSKSCAVSDHLTATRYGRRG